MAVQAPFYHPDVLHANQPVCSIIIPLFNRVEQTRSCLESLANNTGDRISFELILIDNASSDATAQYLRTLTGNVTVLTNRMEFPVAKSCNQGARLAAGQYLVFLRQTVCPQENWLNPLLETVSSGTASIAGAKILTLDGRIHHAGIAFDDQLLPYHIFRGFGGDVPAVARPRALQAVSGECLLVARDTFQALGGFDEAYRGGLEDVDLCLRTSARGGKVLYVPESVLASVADSRDSVTPDFQSLERFMAQWQGKVVPDDTALYEEAGFVKKMMPDGRTYILPASGAATHESPRPTTAPPAAPAPASDGDLHEKAEALLRDGDEEGARVALEQALAADPTSAVVCNDLGVLLVRHQEAERALELHERAVKQAPDNAVFQKNLADLYFVVFGRTDEAVDIYVRLLDRNPQDVEVLCALGQISATLGREKEATIFLSRAVHFDPGNEVARDLLREVTSPAAPSSPVASPPSSRERYEAAGRLAFQGDRKGAIAQLESLIADEPGNALAHNDLGVLYSQEEDFQRALAHHERAAGLEPGNLTFSKNLAEMYLVGFGRVDDAIITYTDLLRRFPEDVEVLLGLAQISLSLSRLEETRSFCERVISLDPANDAAGQILALLHSAGPEPVEADSDIRRLEQLVESDPGNAAALNDLGVHYWQQGDAARSCACYERAVRLEPGNVTFRKNLADLYAVAFGRIDDAVVILVEIITANPDDAEAIFTLGQLCIAAGRTDDARTMIGRVVQLDPSHPYAPLLLKELQDPDFFLAPRQ